MATKLKFNTNFGFDGDSEGTLVVDDINNRVGIKTYNPGYTLDVDGDINLSTSSVLRINGTEILSSSSLSQNVSVNASSLTGTISGSRGVSSGSSSSSFVAYNGTTKTSAQFDGGTVNPSSTTRLNYDGHFYATKFFGDGSGLSSVISSTNSTTSDILTVSGSNLVAVDAGTSDKLIFWDDSASKITYLTLGSGLSITGTTITATASGGGGSFEMSKAVAVSLIF